MVIYKSLPISETELAPTAMAYDPTGKNIVCHRWKHCMLLAETPYATGRDIRRQITVKRNVETHTCTSHCGRCPPNDIRHGDSLPRGG